jgi:REP element-mobilizing transposase RayT
MRELVPIYTADNCSFACPLQWGLSVFWRLPPDDASWYGDLAEALETDGIRLLGHRLSKPGVSQFAISTTPKISPITIVQRVKGRLQYLVRDRLRQPLQRNYAIRSFGRVTRATVEEYTATQLGHHRMADPRVQARLAQYQIHRKEVDLSLARHTSHGIYWYNLHIVVVHRERWAEVREDRLRGVQEMIIGACAAKNWLLSRAAILADHVHLVLGCTLDVSPLDVGLSFLNNLAYVHKMRPVFQFGAFLGTVGEYDQHAVVTEIPLTSGSPGPVQ